MHRLVLLLLFVAGCGGGTSYVHTDAPLGRVVIYRNGIAYYERVATTAEGVLRLSVPADKVDDFLKSLTVADARTGTPLPIAYPTAVPGGDGLMDMEIQLPGKGPHELRLSYITEAPAWKPSYRIVVDKEGAVTLQGWAIVDNTSGEDWRDVKVGVGSSSALSFRYDLRSIRLVQRDTLHSNDLFAQAPPLGSAAYGTESGIVTVLGELDDRTIASAGTIYKSPVSGAAKAGRLSANVDSTGGGSGYYARGTDEERQGDSPILDLASQLRDTQQRIVIEGYADGKDGDAFQASLERANRVREELIRNGAAPEQVVAVGNGRVGGRSGGVRIVSANVQQQAQPAAEEPPAAEAQEPIGTSHFESATAMTVPRGTSAMVAILDAKTEAEIVYLYDSESARGNARFPFQAVRLRNPSESTLESGPVTVYGSGRFIGEGLSEPIPGGAIAFVPFALDRQVVVDREEETRDHISRLLAVQRGVVSSEVQHTRRTKVVLHNRQSRPVSVYIRHSIPKGYSIVTGPAVRERVGAAHLFRVELAAESKEEVILEAATPVFRSVDIRSAEGFEMVRAYLSAPQADDRLRGAMQELVSLHEQMADIDQRIGTLREQMEEYRARTDEIHVQVVTLRAVKGGATLVRHLEKKLQEMSAHLSRSTIELVGEQERLMVARIRFQDAISELTLERAVAGAAL